MGWNKYFYLLVFLIPLVFNPFGGVNPHELTKQSWFFAVIGLFALFLLYPLWKNAKAVFRINRTILFISSTWAASFLLSTLFSIAPIESFWGSYDRLQGLFTAFYYSIHFILCLELFRKEKAREFFFQISAFSGLIIAIYAILQRFHIDPFYPFAQDPFPGRSFATLGYPNGLGEFLIFPFFITGFLALREWQKDRFESCMFWLVTAVILTGVLASHNRASLLGIGFTSAVGVFLILKERRWKILLCASLIILLGGAIWFFSHDVRSLGTRLLLWKSSLPLISEHFFLLGSGPETFYQTIQTVFPKDLYLFERLTDIPDRSHNILLDTFLTRGFLGFLLQILNIGFLVYLIVRKKLKTLAARIAFSSILAYAISMQFSFSLAATIVFLLTMWAILLLSTFHFRLVTFPLTVPRKILASILLIGFFFVSISTAYHRIAADMLFGKAIPAYLIDEQEGFSIFGKAIDHSPSYGYLYRSALIFFTEFAAEKPIFIPTLEKYAKQLGEITNESFHYALAKAELEAAKGNREQAKVFFENTKREAPRWLTLWDRWGRFAFENKRYEEAIEKFEIYLGLAPPYWKWLPDLPKRTGEEQEKYRIFRLSNQGFYETLAMLIESYERVGNFSKAKNLKQFL